MTCDGRKCRICGAGNAIRRPVDLTIGEVEIRITAPLCSGCAESAPDKLRGVMASPLVKTAARIIGVQGVA